METRDPTRLDPAEQALNDCLLERTKDAEPFRWAMAQWNLADLALARHTLAPDPALLPLARAHVMAAREVFADGSEYQSDRCDALLAQIDAAEAAPAKA